LTLLKNNYVPFPELGPPKTNIISAGDGGLTLLSLSLAFNSSYTYSLFLVASTLMQLFLS